MPILLGYPRTNRLSGAGGTGSVVTTEPEPTIFGERVLRQIDGIIITDNGPENFVDFSVDASVVRTTLAQTVTNKTLITPIITYPWIVVTSDYTVLVSDSFVLANATTGLITITLPAAAVLSGQRISIKKTDSSSNKVIVGSVSLIDTVATFTLNKKGESIDLFCNGATYFII